MDKYVEILKKLEGLYDVSFKVEDYRLCYDIAILALDISERKK